MSYITRYLPFDTETGGIPDEVSLLSAYFKVLDENLNVIDTLSLFTKPNDGIYHVAAGGMAVNKINLVEHDKIAKTYSEAGQLLFHFLKKNSDNGKIKLIPLGKNIPFDVLKVTGNLMGEKTWNTFVSYRMIDLTTLAMSLQIKGKLPAGMSLSLFALAEHFHIYTKYVLVGNPHEAEFDTEVTIAVYKELLNLI
jgi:hypothetical protein